MRYTADQLGHEDARFTMRWYAQASKRRDRMAPAQRRAFDVAVEWAQLTPIALDELEAPDRARTGTSDAASVDSLPT